MQIDQLPSHTAQEQLHLRKPPAPLVIQIGIAGQHVRGPDQAAHEEMRVRGGPGGRAVLDNPIPEGQGGGQVGAYQCGHREGVEEDTAILAAAYQVLRIELHSSGEVQLIPEEIRAGAVQPQEAPHPPPPEHVPPQPQPDQRVIHPSELYNILAHYEQSLP